ncbi:tripartite tricarboxylate transporter substrate binding protein [Paracoccus sp. S-4012]|uniref:tripartite tricarboxylate transporter substrate binding protein n=1 Tax=Paracoccus sp. S-4012 TaxID=2665648 RepID=UPI0012B15488|nr:tripartite tricarboxylate transporter substrate binding protein [Paracoccus sp. S-4012]MRX48938.1 tripartite tricarboxylate transporter substrate binding protein [Paracoccus sp. S-4012]
MIRTLIGAAAAVVTTAGLAMADPAVVMAPGGPGGGYDAMARQPFEAMAADGIFTDGATFTNRGGAGGTIGLAEFVNANRGNDNAVMSMGSILVGGILLNDSPVTLEDVTPLARLINDTGVVAVGTNSPFQTIDDLVAAMKENLGGVSIGGGSAGGVDHIAAALIAQGAGLDPKAVNYIAYDSGADAVTAIGGGAITAAISGVSEFKPMADAGRIRILAVTSEERFPGIDAPSLKEAGIDVAIGNWRGWVGAPDMSEEGRQMWLDRLTRMHEGEAWQKVLETQGWEDAFLAGEDFVAFLEEEKARQAGVLRDIGLID